MNGCFSKPSKKQCEVFRKEVIEHVKNLGQKLIDSALDIVPSEKSERTKICICALLHQGFEPIGFSVDVFYESKKGVFNTATKMPSYREEMIKRVKELGQELIDRAEEIVPAENSMVAEFSISSYFQKDEAPTFSVDVTYVNKNTLNRLIKGE